MTERHSLSNEQDLKAFELFEELIDLPVEQREAALTRSDAEPEVLDLCRRMLKKAPGRDDSTLLRPERVIDTNLAREIYGTAIVPKIPDSFDGFEIQGVVGRGGMGLVFEAKQIDIDRRVAIKVVAHREPNPRVLERFQQEIDFLARLDHPAIVQVLSSGMVATDRGEIPYFALEYIDGAHFDAWAKDTAGRDPRVIAAKIAEIAKALDHAHRRGVVHRDLKPANLMIDDEGHPHVLDFGIAREIDEELLSTASLTRDSAVLGTMHYIAPEQLVAASDVDARADIYSLGVVLYEALTGERPLDLDETHWIRAAAQIQALPPRDLLEAREDLDPDLGLVVRKCLEKDRSLRYATAADLAEDLNTWLSGRAVKARPPGAIFRLQKSLRRNRIAMAGIIALSVGALFAIQEWNRRQLQQAQRLGSLGDRSAVSEISLAASEADDLFPITPAQVEPLQKWVDFYASRIEEAAARAEAVDVEKLPGDAAVFEASRKNAVAIAKQYLEEEVKNVKRRLEVARNMRDVWPIENKAAWDRAIAEVAAHPLFNGLQLEPHWDLLPLFDERSPLPLFLHLPTHEGDPVVERYPESKFADQRLRVEKDTGIILALVPGIPESLWGLSFSDVRGGDSAPYLLGVHEVTIAQWLRMSEELKEPNLTGVREKVGGAVVDVRYSNPVELFSFERAKKILGRYSLEVPHSRHLEGPMMWIPGREGVSWLDQLQPKDLAWLDNFPRYVAAPEAERRPDLNPTNCADWENHSPVDMFPASPSGFHGLLGNVAEWCSNERNHSTRYAVGIGHLSQITFDPEYPPNWTGHREPLTQFALNFPRPDIGVRAYRPIEPGFDG